MMMRLLLCLLQILFLMWVSLIEHYWVILRERRRVCMVIRKKTVPKTTVLTLGMQPQVNAVKLAADLEDPKQS